MVFDGSKTFLSSGELRRSNIMQGHTLLEADQQADVMLEQKTQRLEPENKPIGR